MKRRVRSAMTLCAAAALGLSLASSVTPAQARWSFHNSIVGERILAPRGGAESQTCAHRLRALSGFNQYIDVDSGEDPAAYQLPEYALSPAAYQVWRAPDGFTSFGAADQDYATGDVFFWESDGGQVPASLVGRVTTPPRRVLATPEPVSGDARHSDNFVFATAPIDVTLTDVRPGDTLGLSMTGVPGIITVTAIDCRLPVVKAKVDLIPGSRANVVDPAEYESLLPVRVYGTKSINVRRIVEIHLGGATPATVPAELRRAARPRDLNGDGRADRLYYFRQGQVDLSCSSTSVRITGATSVKKRFTATSPIRVDCDR